LTRCHLRYGRDTWSWSDEPWTYCDSRCRVLHQPQLHVRCKLSEAVIQVAASVCIRQQVVVQRT